MGQYNTINAIQLTPLHDVDSDSEHYLALHVSLSGGWDDNRPAILVCGTAALTGSHRLAIAIDLGLEVEVYDIEEDLAEDEVEELFTADDDDGRLETLVAYADETAIEIMTAEVDANE